MASEKIQLEIGGKYTAKAAFGETNADIKNLQKSSADMVNSTKQGLTTLAGSFSG